MIGLVNRQRNTDVSVTSEQTLTIAAPGYGILGTAVYQRNFTNMEGGVRRPAPLDERGLARNNFTISVTVPRMSYPQ